VQIGLPLQFLGVGRNMDTMSPSFRRIRSYRKSTRCFAWRKSRSSEAIKAKPSCF
jgi:hypothetical protein